MLGDRRSNSLFAAAPSAAPAEARQEQAEVHDISFEENTGRAIFAETKVAPKASDVFFAPQAEGMPFAEVLTQVQSYLSGTYATLITENGDEAKEQMKRRIARYLQDNRMAVDGISMIWRTTDGVKLLSMDVDDDIKGASIAKVRESVTKVSNIYNEEYIEEESDESSEEETEDEEENEEDS